MKANLKKILGMAALGMSLMVGTVQAESLLASGPVFGGPTQTRVACQVFNAGTAPITFVSTEISSQFHTSVPLTFDNCGTALAPNHICTFQAAASNQAFSCKVRIIQAKTNVRGAMAALNSSSAALSEADLR